MRLGIRTKLIGSFLVTITIFVIGLGVLSLVVLNVNSTLREMQNSQHKVELAGQLQLHLNKLLKPANNYLIMGDVRERDNFDGGIIKIHHLMRELQGQKGGKQWEALAADMSEEILKLVEMLVTVVYIDQPVGNKKAADLMEEANLHSERLIRQAENFTEMTRQEMSRMVDASRARNARVKLAYFGTAGTAVAFLALLSFYLSRYLIGPIMNLHMGARIVAGGNLDYRQPVETSDEIGDLTTEFNRMVSALSQMKKDLDQKLEETRQLAITDSLTGLYNHRFCVEKISEEMKRSERYDHALSIILIDIDSFKHYNDTNGHIRGDDLLKILSSILKRQVRSADYVCRTGGEEFVIILPETEEAVAIQTAERLRVAVAQHPFPYREAQPEGRLTISLGVASYSKNEMNLQSLIKGADDALYRAKRAGKNKVATYIPEPNPEMKNLP